MIDFFVSFYPGNTSRGPELVAALWNAGCVVAHSPEPDAMDDWYASGLSSALDRANAFVCVVSPAWDSSTWMAIEADEALRRFNAGRIDGYFCYNPEGRIVRAAGMLPYLRNPLPGGLADAVAALLGNPPRRTATDGS